MPRTSEGWSAPRPGFTGENSSSSGAGPIFPHWTCHIPQPHRMMIDAREIKQHIAGHALWKVRLRDAVDSGGGELDAGHIRPDDRCAFGKWLMGLPSVVQATSHWRDVKELHRLFHQEAANVVETIQRGDHQAAQASIRMRGAFSRRTSRLTQAMVAWMETSIAG